MSGPGPTDTVRAVAGFQLAAPDPAAASAFLRDVLGARAAYEGGLRLGDTRLQVVAGERRPPFAADDPRFQHLALVVGDMAAAHARVAASGTTPVSRGGPVTLPPASGGVTAWKFLSPWNQPFELLQTPTDAWRRRAAGAADLVLGVDHTAFVCIDVDAALRLLPPGFTAGASTHNIGPEQDALDGLRNADLRVRTLYAPEAGPHLELLTYAAPRLPPAAGAGSGSAVTTLLLGGGGAAARTVLVGGHAFRVTDAGPDRRRALP